MKRSFPSVITGILLLVFPALAFSQQVSPLTDQVQNLYQNGVDFYEIAPFQLMHREHYPTTLIVRDAEYLELDMDALALLWEKRPEYVRLSIPYHGEMVTVDLFQKNIMADGFSILTSTSNGEAVDFEPGLYYRGIISGTPNTLAAVSFFNNGIMAVITEPDRGNLVLGRLEYDDNLTGYVFYEDQKIIDRPPFSCEILRAPDAKEETLDPLPQPDVDGCVDVFFECDYELFENKGTVQATYNYVTGFYNVVSTIFTNEFITVSISQMYIWTTEDDYPTNSSNDVLNAFRNLRTFFVGDLAHLVGLGGGSLGGIAYLDVLCSNNYNYAYSNIWATYSGLPNYSWTVMVVTHEMGHNLGSNHTHWCGWNAGALDDCYTPEGNCQPGPPPQNGGTIMSYCHLTGYGINLVNGFGQEPGNKIRTEVTNAENNNCIATNCPNYSCTAPTNITVSNITNSSATISWGAIGGATSYTIQYRILGNPGWITINNASSPYSLTGLSNDTDYEVQVKAVCGGSSSNYAAGVIFTTNASGCNQPSNLVVTSTTNNTATLNWTENGGATTWQIEYGLRGFAQGSGTTVTANTRPYTVTGLQDSRIYEWYVRADCNGSFSAWAGPEEFRTSLANDQGTGAVLLTLGQSCEGTNIFRNTGATTSSGEFSPTVANGGYWATGISHTVWFKFVAPTSGSVKITTDYSPQGSLDDTQVALYHVTNPSNYGSYLHLSSNEDGGQIGLGWQAILYYTGLTPGTMYYIQVDGYQNDTGEFCIEVNEEFEIGDPGATCEIYNQAVNGAAAPNKWFNIYTEPNGFDIGRPLAAVKTSQNLGNVTMDMQRYSSVQQAPNGVHYMQRYADFSCTNNANGTKEVRILYSNAELDNLKTASGNFSATNDDLNISHYDGPNENCSPNDNSGPANLITAVTPTDIPTAGVFYLDFQVPNFSEMAAHFGFQPLPVELNVFTGTATESGNLLQWKSEWESNLEIYIVERAQTNGLNWQEIGRVQPNAGKQYQFLDREPPAKGYYRLKILDFTGEFEYSPIVFLEQERTASGIISLYPNPATESINLTYAAASTSQLLLTLSGSDGTMLWQQEIEAPEGISAFPIEIANLPPGLYLLQIQNDRERVESRRFVKK